MTAAVMDDASAPSERLDVLLVRRGLARSREHASTLIAAGAVTVRGQTVTKASTRVGTDAPVVASSVGPSYVSRGGHKLAGALADLGPAGLVVVGRRCLDAGASTGGFTQVLLEAGAGIVHAVDVGTAQLAPSLVADPRVVVHDATNVRDLDPQMLGGPVDLVVADLSFISLGKVLAGLARCVVETGDLLLMVKPQFEVGRGRVGADGVVRSPDLRLLAVAAVAESAAELGLGIAGASVSRLPGPAGNIEYFLWCRRDAPEVDAASLEALVRTASSMKSRRPGTR
ncbi:MAG: TlyA family RNA methyltransferase [Actinomycetota bacterium]|nr:TlyA family RNA methyltransferase [Actinomycetota bacterium]